MVFVLGKKLSYWSILVVLIFFIQGITSTTTTTGKQQTMIREVDVDDGKARAPQWMYDFVEYRQHYFDKLVHPIIETLLGPPTEEEKEEELNTGEEEDYQQKIIMSLGASEQQPLDSENYLTTTEKTTHRRLSFYIPDYVNTASAYRETNMTFANLTFLFFIMGCILIVFLNCFYHNQKTSPVFISPRRHRLPKLVPPPLPVYNFFSWLKIIIFISDEEIINRVGYDSLIFLRFHRLALRCIVKMSIFSFIIILPLNFTGGESNYVGNDLKGYVGDLLFTDFMRFTMANVSGGSPRLWVHCFAAYLLTGIVVRELLKEYNVFHNIRHRYLLSKESHLRTVLVTNIPRHLRSAKKITTYFKNVYPEAVQSVTLSQNLIQLEKFVAQRTQILGRIEKELLVLCRNEKRKLVEQSKWGRIKLTLSFWNLWENMSCCNNAQERLTTLYNKLEDINVAIEKEQIRRRRVMKKLDNMEGVEGSNEIDYYLASPFVSYDPKSMSELGLNHVSVDEQQPVSTYSVGAPRSVDNSVRNLFHYQPPTLAGKEQRHGYDTPPYDSSEYSKHNTGPFLRSPNRTETTDTTPTTNSSSSSASTSSVPSNNSQQDSDAAQKKNNKKKKRLPRFLQAKRAIRRYSKVARKTDFIGKPTTGQDNQYDEFLEKNPHACIENHVNEVTDKAFVVMRTFTASTIAIQSMHSSRPGSMKVTTAPEPRDILWSNIYFSKGARRMRSFIADIIVFLIVVFYVIPVAIVSLLVSKSALISMSPRLEQLDQASALFSSAISLVQPICIVAIQQLLPVIFMQIGKAEGIIAFSEVQMRAFSRYFGFQVLNVFLVTVITGSFFDTVATIIETPESAFRLLGNALPKLSTFFITFVIMKTFLGLGVELVRIVAIVQASIRHLLFPNSTLRAKRSVRIGCRAIDNPGWFPFHKVLAQDMLVVVISVVFSVVAPLVLLPCALFCLFSRILWTHQHLYVFESVFETGGQFWPKIFRRFIFGLIIAQATITGQFILKEARIEALATLALMGLTYLFLRSTRARYDQASYTLPLEVATIMDISESQEEELRKKQHEYSHNNVSNTPLHSHTENPYVGTNLSDVEESEANGLGATIGNIDPFENAYIQPALRATPRARPEQPFPPAQLGREELFLGGGSNINPTVSSSSTLEEETLVNQATVRLKSMNREDRELVDVWWQEKLVEAGPQNWMSVLTGQSCGTLRLGPKGHTVERNQHQDIEHNMSF